MAVHLYTASGAVLALLMLVAAFQGEAVKALWLMLLRSSSTLPTAPARRFRVSEALPFFDGALLDNIVDYMTYVFAPCGPALERRVPAQRQRGDSSAALPLLASSYQFCRVDAKTEDHYSVSQLLQRRRLLRHRLPSRPAGARRRARGLLVPGSSPSATSTRRARSPSASSP